MVRTHHSSQQGRKLQWCRHTTRHNKEGSYNDADTPLVRTRKEAAMVRTHPSSQQGRKLQWCGHTTRHNNLPKELCRALWNGEERGRPRKMWLDNMWHRVASTHWQSLFIDCNDSWVVCLYILWWHLVGCKADNTPACRVADSSRTPVAHFTTWLGVQRDDSTRLILTCQFASLPSCLISHTLDFSHNHYQQALSLV